MPRPSNEQVKTAILQVIHMTPEGSLRPMSSNEMSRILRQDYGLCDRDSKKVPTQIRRSGPLHHDWKRAFKTQRFSQKNGRPPLSDESSSYEGGGEDEGVGFPSKQARKHERGKIDGPDVANCRKRARHIGGRADLEAVITGPIVQHGDTLPAACMGDWRQPPVPSHMDPHRQYMPHHFVPAMPMSCMLPPDSIGPPHPVMPPPGIGPGMMHGGGMMMSLPTNRGAAPHPPVGQPAAMPSELLVDARLLIAAMDAAAGHPPPLEGETAPESSSSSTTALAPEASSSSCSTSDASSSSSSCSTSSARATSKIGSTGGISFPRAVAPRQI
jgi:hypothetical protein